MFNINYDVDYIDSEEYENLKSKYDILCSREQINFLVNLILNYKFSDESKIRNIVEIGVHAGAVSYYILKQAIDKLEGGINLFSYDISEENFIGSISFDNLSKEYLQNYTLYKGMSFEQYCVEEENKFKKEKIDLAFIDGCHVHPAPLIDFLFLLPFMKENGLIVFHDIADWIINLNQDGAYYTYSGLNCEKYQLNNDNIGFIVVPKDKNSLFDSILKIVNIPLLSIKDYCFSEEELEMVEKFIFEYYPFSFASSFISTLKNNIQLREAQKPMLLKNELLISKMSSELEKIKKYLFYLSSGYFASKKVLLYGFDTDIEESDLRKKIKMLKLKIIGISSLDAFFEKKVFGYKVVKIEEISKKKFDFICIISKNKFDAQSFLINKLHIPASKIVDFLF